MRQNSIYLLSVYDPLNSKLYCASFNVLFALSATRIDIAKDYISKMHLNHCFLTKSRYSLCIFSIFIQIIIKWNSWIILWQFVASRETKTKKLFGFRFLFTHSLHTAWCVYSTHYKSAVKLKRFLFNLWFDFQFKWFACTWHKSTSNEIMINTKT